MMMRASQHITYTPQDETTRVKRLLKSIVSNDMNIFAAITTIKADNINLTDFDEVREFIVITAPPHRNLETGSQNVCAFSTNTGRTEVELRYYKRDSFGQLSDK